MKTPKQMMDRAIAICENDPNSRIAVIFVSSNDLVKTIRQFSQFQGSKWDYLAPGGGRVMAIHIPPSNDTYSYSNIHVLAGCQFTHVFITDLDFNQYNYRYIRSRLRSANQCGPEPMGIYWPHIVERFERY